MMRYGYQNYLKQKDLWNLRKRDTSSSCYEKFEEAWEAEHERRRPSLWITLFRGYGGPFFRGSIFKTAADFLSFVQPQLLRLLINFVESYSGHAPKPVIEGAAIALAMFAVSVTQTMCLHQVRLASYRLELLERLADCTIHSTFKDHLKPECESEQAWLLLYTQKP